MASRRQRPKKLSWGVITIVLVLVLSGSVLVFTVSRHSNIAADYTAYVPDIDSSRLGSSTVLPSGSNLAAEAPAFNTESFDVMFRGSRLGITLEESLGGSLWPIVAAIDRATAAHSLIEPGRVNELTNTQPNSVNTHGLHLPGVGDQLVAINGRPVLDEPRISAAAAAGPAAVFDAVLETIEGAGRPLQLTFLRPVTTIPHRSANDARPIGDSNAPSSTFAGSHSSVSKHGTRSKSTQQTSYYSSSSAQTRNANNNSTAPVSSRVVERGGLGWSESGVRPGCVYWWCFPHPKAPAPPGPPGTMRPPQDQRWVNEAWLQTLRQRYPDHVRKIHPNRSAYYTEPKKHYDLFDVAFGNGAVHLFAPRDAHTQHLLSRNLRRSFQEDEAAKHKAAQQPKGKKRKQRPTSSSSSSPRGHGDEDERDGAVHRLPCYESVDKGSDKTGLCPEIVVHNSPLDVASHCQNGAMHPRTLFFLAPHYPGNFFHLMNDNLVPLVTDLQAFPECNPQDLTCTYPPALAQFWFDKNRKAGGATAWWDALFPAIFGPPLTAETQVLGFASHKHGQSSHKKTSSSSGGTSSFSSSSASKLYCVKRASWGLGPRPFYTDFVEQRIAALSAVRQVALRYHGIFPNMMDDNALTSSPPLRGVSAATIVNDGRSTPRVAGDKLPVVVFVKRYKKKKEDNPRGGGLHYNRVLGDPEMLTHAFQKEGVVLRECCDFERDFATQPSSSSSSSLGKTSSSAQTSSRTSAMLEMVRRADVIVSLHGAGLVNCVFAKDGATLVELHGGYGADDVIFRRLAQGRRGGYLKARVDEKLEQHDVGEDRATAIAACVVALYNGRECNRPLNSEIEEAYRAVDMV